MINYISSIILLISLNCFAQAPRGLWVAGGANYSSINSDQLKTDSSPGYGIGAIFTMGYHESYNYEFSLMYNKNRFDFHKSDFNGNDLGITKFSREAIELGMNFNYYPIMPDENKFYGGVQAGINVSYNGEFTDIDDNGREDFFAPLSITSRSISLNRSKFNYGTSLGIVAGYNNLRVLLKYNLGLSNYINGMETPSYDDNNRYTGPEIKGNLSYLSLTVFYEI